MEAYRLKKYIGAYTAALGRVDALIFTAGVGEMSDLMREKVLDGLEILGIKYSAKKNHLAKTRNCESDISAGDSRVKIFVIPTDEELVFIEDVVALLEGKYDVHTNFRYSFEKPEYQNLMRMKAFKKECKKNSALNELLINK